MFAIPASMLTWGFEGEAERLAKLRWKQATGQNNGTQQTENDRNDDWSYSRLVDCFTRYEITPFRILRCILSICFFVSSLPSFPMAFISNDYSTDEEYLNTIAGFEDDEDNDEEDEAKKVFALADLDGSGNISLGEFLKLSREIEANREMLNKSLRDPSPLLANRLQKLEEKVEDNSKKLDRICNILEGRKF
jgi:hypothetical protein